MFAIARQLSCSSSYPLIRFLPFVLLFSAVDVCVTPPVKLETADRVDLEIVDPTVSPTDFPTGRRTEDPTASAPISSSAPSCDRPYAVVLKLNGDLIFKKDTWDGEKIEYKFTPSAGGVIYVEIFTDLYPGETSWELFNANNDVIGNDYDFTEAYVVYTTMVVRIKAGEKYTFVLSDDEGNGQNMYSAFPCS